MDVIVIGGGPAGMMAAWAAAMEGAAVSLWERNSRLGRKLAITGKGRCNITNQSDIGELIKHIPGNGSFLYGAFSRFSPQDVIDFFQQAGLAVKVERGRRVFPQSDKAADVVDVLTKLLRQAGVAVAFERRAKALRIRQGTVQGVVDWQGRFFPASRVIVASGGASYPATGSTGDGYLLAQAAGHDVVPPQPSLAPLVTVERWPAQVMGLSLKNVRLRAEKAGKILAEEFGEMLFTHFGISGPIVLTLSRAVIEAGASGVQLYLDLKPALDVEQLRRRLDRDLQKFARRQLQNGLDELLPSSLIPVFLHLSGIDIYKTCNQLTKNQRQTLVSLMKALPLTVQGHRPLAEAIVTKGGVRVDQVSPKTMESKLARGLYFAGEVLDVDGYTGGDNLQSAWSSGYVAGQAAGRGID